MAINDNWIHHRNTKQEKKMETTYYKNKDINLEIKYKRNTKTRINMSMIWSKNNKSSKIR